MIIEIDNFADAKVFRELAFSADFYDFDAPDGETYKRVQIVELPEITKKLEQILGSIQMLGSGFRLNYNGELPNQAIHSDLGWGSHALVLYLSDGPGGTAFWQHKKTGAKSIKVGQVDLLELIEGDWDSPDKWEQVYLCEGKPGKAVIYPSELFHSRWPFEAYGDSPENGRLIAVAFFNRVKE